MSVRTSSSESPGPACRLSTTIAFVDPSTPSSSGDHDTSSVSSCRWNTHVAVASSSASRPRSTA